MGRKLVVEDLGAQEREGNDQFVTGEGTKEFRVSWHKKFMADLLNS